MGIFRQHFHCVELVSGKSEISSYPTRWGAEMRCHKLNKWNPQERWTVMPSGIRYVPEYNEQGNMSRTISLKESLKHHFNAVKGKNCNCLFCRNWNPQERWTVMPFGIRYVQDYNEQGNESRKIPFKDSLNQHFKAVKGKKCNCLFCRNLNRKEG